MHSPSHHVHARAEHEPECDAERHDADREEVEHRDEDDLGRHRKARPDLELHACGERVGENEEEEEEEEEG